MGIIKKEKKTDDSVVRENLYYDSKSLLKTSYNYNTQQLIATFTKGNVYIYGDVPVKIYEGIKTAESVGTYFAKSIKNSYTYKKLGNIDVNTITEELSKLSD